MRNQKGYVSGYNGQLVVTAQQVIVGAMLSQHPGERLHHHSGQADGALSELGVDGAVWWSCRAGHRCRGHSRLLATNSR